MSWTADDIPALTGRRVVITGANSGLGLVTAMELARHGAQVTMAVRDTTRGEAAAAGVRAVAPDAGQVEVRRLDLADLASVGSFADSWSQDHPDGLDLLVNNAGIMAIPRRLTADGFETQFGTNHLGHFALTALLFPALVAVPHARIVTVSSQAHRFGKMDFDDLMGERRYSAWGAYGQSKLANLLFTSELQRRIDIAGIPLKALAAHPGFARTNLQSVGPRERYGERATAVTSVMNRLLAQSAEMGALPQLFAATAPELPGGSYIGPDGFLEQRGHPTIVGRSAAAQDTAAARRLWQVSEELTGVVFPI